MSITREQLLKPLQSEVHDYAMTNGDKLHFVVLPYRDVRDLLDGSEVDIAARIIVRSVVDENGVGLLEDEDVDAFLGAVTIPDYVALKKVVETAYGLTQDPGEAAESLNGAPCKS